MERKYRFLYLDDNDTVTRNGDVEYLNNSSDRIEVITDYPGSWRQRVNQILTEISSIDGIILDWELTNKSEDSKQGADHTENVDFSAESLAEHLRVNVITNKTKDLPIILCSADKNKAFSLIRKRELSSSDLFDLTFIKGDLFDKQVPTSEAQLFDLAKTYDSLQTKAQTTAEVLCIADEDLKRLDIRFVDDLEILKSTKTVHDLIQFMLNSFIEREGILITEAVMAARLGVDIDKSKDWSSLKEILLKHDLKYTGILSVGWENFWSHKLEEWWLNTISDEDLRTTGASQRVKLLNEKLGLNLYAAERIKYCSSEEYWTICFGTHRPLDPANGFLIGESLFNPWLEGQYVSAFAELDKDNAEDWRINVMDRERFNSFKAMILKG